MWKSLDELQSTEAGRFFCRTWVFVPKDGCQLEQMAVNRKTTCTTKVLQTEGSATGS